MEEDNKTIIRLDGTRVDSDGKITKTNFFKILGIDLTPYKHLSLTEQEAKNFTNYICRIKYGVTAAIPWLCTGPKCPNKICTLHGSKKYPLAAQCPVEVNLIISWTQGYMDSLDVDPDNLMEVALVNKLVECELLDYRINLNLSGGVDEEAAMLLKTSFVDNGKTVSETLNVHPLVDVKTRIHKTRMELLESFAVTRREKYKKLAALKQGDTNDVSSHLADLAEVINSKKISVSQIKAEINNTDPDPDIIEADWET